MELGDNSVVHQADRVVVEKAKTLQDRIVISINIGLQLQLGFLT